MDSLNRTDGLNAKATGDERELRLLEEIERSPRVTQRALSRKLTIGLGMTNLLLRRLASKGYVRARQASWRSWAYALTPKGVARKTQLVAMYVERVLARYRTIRETLDRELSAVGLDSASRVAIYWPDETDATRELAELMLLSLTDLGVQEVHVFAQSAVAGQKVVGVPVRPLEGLAPEAYDWVVVAAVDGGRRTLSDLRGSGVVPARILTPLSGRRATVAAAQRTGPSS